MRYDVPAGDITPPSGYDLTMCYPMHLDNATVVNGVIELSELTQCKILVLNNRSSYRSIGTLENLYRLVNDGAIIAGEPPLYPPGFKELENSMEQFYELVDKIWGGLDNVNTSKSIGKLLPNGTVNLFIDLKPALDDEKLDKRLLRDLDENSKKSIKNILPELLPKSLIPVMYELTGIDPDQKAHTITKELRGKLHRNLKQLPLTVCSLLGYNKSIITSGGVNLKEIDPKTMHSKIMENVYFIGEILDLDGPTGGFNLQVCWTSGYVAGEDAAYN